MKDDYDAEFPMRLKRVEFSIDIEIAALLSDGDLRSKSRQVSGPF